MPKYECLIIGFFIYHKKGGFQNRINSRIQKMPKYECLIIGFFIYHKKGGFQNRINPRIQKMPKYSMDDLWDFHIHPFLVVF